MGDIAFTLRTLCRNRTTGESQIAWDTTLCTSCSCSWNDIMRLADLCVAVFQSDTMNKLTEGYNTERALGTIHPLVWNSSLDQTKESNQPLRDRHEWSSEKEPSHPKSSENHLTAIKILYRQDLEHLWQLGQFSCVPENWEEKNPRQVHDKLVRTHIFTQFHDGE